MDPQLAGRLGSLEEAHVGAIVAAETYKGDAEWEQFVDHGGRPWWWREMDPTTGRDECFSRATQSGKSSWTMVAGPGGGARGTGCASTSQREAQLARLPGLGHWRNSVAPWGPRFSKAAVCPPLLPVWARPRAGDNLGGRRSPMPLR